MAVTEKLILFTDEDYGDIGEADSAGYYDVSFTFVCVDELSNAQAICRFTMEVNGVLLNKLYRLGVAYEGAEPTVEEAEAALSAYLSALYSSATAAA